MGSETQPHQTRARCTKTKAHTSDQGLQELRNELKEEWAQGDASVTPRPDEHTQEKGTKRAKSDSQRVF